MNTDIILIGLFGVAVTFLVSIMIPFGKWLFRLLRGK